MSILLVDDSADGRELLKRYLIKAGFKEVIDVDCAAKAFEVLEREDGEGRGEDGERKGMEIGEKGVHIDLILMDFIMPDMDGLTAVKLLKSKERLKDIPVIMITANADDISLQAAFEAGATDFVKKPVNKIELVARIKSSLHSKYQMDYIKQLAMELKAAKKRFEALSNTDGLTQIANRRYFDDFFERQWRVCRRSNKHISVILMDIDFFKRFNDIYGHQAGDDCLKQAAAAVKSTVHRPGDLAARYGGEEFVVVLAETTPESALIIAEAIRSNVRSTQIPHKGSDADKFVTMSLGIASIIPTDDLTPQELLLNADKALYRSKEAGRNRVTTFRPE